MNKLFVEDLKDVKGKRVMVRVDFNVPLDDQLRITSDARITAAMPTIECLSRQGAKVILLSHLGRPKGKIIPKFSLKPVAIYLSEKLGKPIPLAEDCVGTKAQEKVNAMSDGDILLLENLRFHAEEEKNDPGFSKQLSELGDLYVNDAFGTAHRAHASTAGITKHFSQNACGCLMKKELDFLGTLLSNPARPFVAVLGGAKISGKIDVINNLLDKVDAMLIGGGMTYTFYKAMELEIGNSLLETDKLILAEDLLRLAKEKGVNFQLAVDFQAAKGFFEDADTVLVPFDGIPKDRECLDIGPKTIEAFGDTLGKAKTIFWNGPMGVFEMDKFAKGTNEIAKVIADATQKGAVSIIGGGDSAAAAKKAGLSKSFTHISTGGGASLEFMEGKELPGVAALTSKN